MSIPLISPIILGFGSSKQVEMSEDLGLVKYNLNQTFVAAVAEEVANLGTVPNTVDGDLWLNYMLWTRNGERQYYQVLPIDPFPFHISDEI